jgi:hypothetical protein
MRQKKTGQLVGAIFGNIIAIVVVNSLLAWRQWTQGVILESWVGILWATNLSLMVQLAGSLILVFYRPPAMVAFMNMAFNAASLVSLIVFYIVLPLDFTPLGIAWLNTVIKVLIVVGMGGACISLIVNGVRLMTGRWQD